MSAPPVFPMVTDGFIRVDMLDNLPAGFYEPGNTDFDHLTIAYKRYCDALLHNGVLERRIANAVMALECIFLKGGETQELLYHLSIRVARVFGLIGLDPHYVKRTLQEAYRIRSLFVHGDQLSYKAKQKLNVKYGSVNAFLLTLLDYCRMSILVATMLKKEKDEYVDLIDGALIDVKGTEGLGRLLHGIRQVVIPGDSGMARSSEQIPDSEPSAPDATPSTDGQPALDSSGGAKESAGT